jgi:integrase
VFDSGTGIGGSTGHGDSTGYGDSTGDGDPTGGFDFEAFEALVTAAGEIDPSKRLFVLLGGEAGMRAGEIRALEWKSIDFRRRVLTVEQSEWKGHVTLPKHDKIRHVPMTARLTQALRDFRHLRGPRVFYLDDEGPLVQRTLRRWLEKVCVQASIEVHSPHGLRHTFPQLQSGRPFGASHLEGGHSAGLPLDDGNVRFAPGKDASSVRPPPGHLGQ